ncbi:MAG TPA: response regulator, partial [Bacteroidota bacterium]|nr:response regulator [Bacteroidota bacterium]
TFQEWKPDIILLDLMMPHIDGFGVMEALKPLIPAEEFIPIIILTADVSAQTRMRALAAGAVDFVTKPFDVMEVTLRIKNFLRTRAIYLQLRDYNVILEEKVRERTAQLYEVNERINLIAAELNDVVWAASPDGKQLLYVNQTFEKVYGFPTDAVKRNTKLWLEVVHPEDRVIAEKSVEELREKGKATVEYRIVRPDSSVRWLLDRKSLLKDRHGNIQLMGGVVSDITERKSMEERILRTQRIESIGTLAGGIAHDLNNILSPILLSINILNSKLKDEKGQAILQVIETSTRRGADLVKQVLSFARGVSGERSMTQIRHVIDEVARMVRETFPKSITLRTDVPKDLPVISADVTQLHQVLMNLLINARDAMPRGGAITVRAEHVMVDQQFAAVHPQAKAGSYLLISVSDQGTGIPKEIVDKIFDPFFTTKEIGKGTGLGLSMVQFIVQNHGGYIDVQTEVGKGTTFKIYLPTVETIELAAPPETTKPPDGNGELILLVDDEASIREILKATLEAHGYEVITAADGTEAVTKYATLGQSISLVLTDIAMPFTDGIAMVHAIRRINPEAKVVALSGFVQNEETMRREFTRFLVKPFSADELLRTVSEIVHHH